MDDFFKRPLAGADRTAMALGCYSMSNAYGRRSDDESLQVIRRAVDRGVEIIDTADYYGLGHNERLVASALAGRRDKVVLSSKFGYVVQPDGSLGLNGRPDYLRICCEGSLARLGTDRIDLYFQHRVDPDVPIEETVGGMAELAAEGKIRALGLCEVSPATLRRAHAVHPIAAIQIEYSLWTRDAEAELLGLCAELGVAVMAFSPLARGMLTGALRSRDQLQPGDVRLKYPRFSEENLPRNVALVDRMADVAREQGCSPAELALAWLFARNPAMFAICGCDTLAFLDANLGALDLRLHPAVVDRLSAMFAPGAVAGDRYHAAMMKMLQSS
ncbi:MAG: aldo/keto reductase [Pseudomonadota bacterium]|nr:aldo/keto reductase [Pseudomonadota bacterium]